MLVTLYNNSDNNNECIDFYSIYVSYKDVKNFIIIIIIKIISTARDMQRGMHVIKYIYLFYFSV